MFKIAVSLLLTLPMMLNAQTTAEEVLAKSLKYHDAENNWSSLSSVFTFKETRPQGDDRATEITLNNAKGYMKIDRNGEEVYEIAGDDVKILKGKEDVTRALMLRNYYLYIWGLPMKLADEGTPDITLVDNEQVGDVTCKVMKIAYEKDTWYFYIDTSSGRMLQYKFYHNNTPDKGELITLENELTFKGIKILQKRNWYTLPDMKYLGTDILEGIR